jgi:hypothetical protein
MKWGGWRGIALVAALAIAWHAPLLWRTAPVAPRPMPERRPEPAFLIFEPPLAAGKVAAALVDWLDPTVFALPSDRGFSAVARRRAPAARLSEAGSHAPSLPRAYEPLLWARGEGEGGPFAEAPPSLGAPVAGEEPSPPAPEEGSAWRVYGEIAGRAPSAASSLPALDRDEPVGPTIVRAAVSPRGEVPYAFVERGSGVEKADDAAVKFVRSLRFASLEGTNAPPLAWGFVKVLWRGEKPPRKTEPVR